MVKIAKEEKEWLQAFQKELLEDHKNEKFNAPPVYYGIWDTKQRPVPDGYGDGVTLYNTNTCESCDLEEFFQELEYEEQLELAEEWIDGMATGVTLDEHDHPCIDCLPDFKEFIEKKHPEYTAMEYEDVPFIQEDALFLTRKAAEEHLEANGHHYGAQAKAYTMTAIRSPQYAHLLELLETIDWEHSEIRFRENPGKGNDTPCTSE